MITQEYIDNIKKNFDGKFVGDARHKFSVGDVGFLLELTPVSGVSRLELRDTPARTTDWTDILYGMIEGRTNVEALGAAKVTEVVKNGRGKVQTIWGDELDAALAELGYPEIRRDEYTVEFGFVKPDDVH
jgi:hypothetical protein